MEKKYLKLNDIGVYKRAFKLSNTVWEIVVKWDYLAKNGVGQQFIRTADSIAANIAEGFGRFSKRDKIRFYRFSSGSIMEALDWNEKSKSRKLLSEQEYDFIYAELQKLPKELNQLIKFTNEKLTI